MTCKCGGDKYNNCNCKNLGKDSVVKITSNGMGKETSNPKNNTIGADRKSKKTSKIPPEYEKMWRSPREK